MFRAWERILIPECPREKAVSTYNAVVWVSAPKALLSDTKLVCQFPDESLISIGGQGPTQTQWPKHPLTGWGQGKRFHWT